jgi:DNA-binding NarL/FixJ family response regulator
MHPEPLRLALLHPRRAWAEVLECLLQARADVDVVVAHTSWEWVHGAVARGDVDVVLIGLGDGTFGPTDVEKLRQAASGLAVAVVSDSTDPDLIAATIRAGARGWLRPTASAQDLVRTLHGVVRGETWIPNDLVTVVLDQLLSAEQSRVVSQSAIAALSAREVEVLDCLAQGMTKAQIAERYLLSPHTVRTHINHVLRKLDVHSTLAAVSIVRKSRVPGQRSAEPSDERSYATDAGGRAPGVGQVVTLVDPDEPLFSIDFKG